MLIMNCSLLIAFIGCCIITMGQSLSTCYFFHYTSHMEWPGVETAPPWFEAGFKSPEETSFFFKYRTDFSVSLLDFTVQVLMLASNGTPQRCATYWQLNFRFFSFTVRVCEFLLFCHS